MTLFRSSDPWRVLWQIAISDYLLGAVLLTLALALLLVAWLPQTSPGNADSDVAWQAQVQNRFGEAAWFELMRPLLRSSGAFQVTGTAWFRFLVALLALALFARLVDDVEGLWRGRDSTAPFDAPTWVTLEGTLDDWRARLRRRRLRILTVSAETDDGKTDNVVQADRWPWGQLGPILVYLGGLIILVGTAVTALGGWQTGPLRLTAGDAIPLGQGSRLTLRLETLAPDGRRGHGELWRGGDTLLSSGDLAKGRPLVGDGVGTYLVGTGPGLQVRATLSATQALKLATGPNRGGEEELVLIFSDDEPRRQVGVPETNLVLLFTMPQPVQLGTWPQVQVFESDSGQFIVEQEAFADSTLEVDQVTFELTPTAYAEIRAARDPGAFWVQLGAVQLMAGLVLAGAYPSRRVWLRRRKQDEALEATGDTKLLSDSAPERDTAPRERREK